MANTKSPGYGPIYNDGTDEQATTAGDAMAHPNLTPQAPRSSTERKLADHHAQRAEDGNKPLRSH